MRRLIAVTLLALLATVGAAAQQPLTYWISNVESEITDDVVVVQFDVFNVGSAATVEQPAHLFSTTGEVLATQTLQPLGANQQVAVTLEVPVTRLPSGTTQTIYVVVGVDKLPPQNELQPPIVGVTQVAIPERSGLAALDLSDNATLAVVVGVAGVVVILLWVVSVIYRMIFSRPPVLTAWQAPYVITPLIDPNSTNGRRQLWQQHAQSDTLPTPCMEGNYMVRKLLVGSSGVKLNGWRVTGLRISQYDRYGRVARTQTVMPKKTVRALNRAARKSQSLDWEHAVRSVRPVARALTGTLSKKMNPQNAILPVALDIRFVGLHGEVGIVFELYGCDGGSWREIDHWEPEMRVVNGSIEENFTYTVAGQYPQEPRKQVRQRMEADLTNLLAAMVQKPPPLPPPEDTTENPVIEAE
ncbi:MAG: hypothetical protein IT319_12045 [Anaerolineae bacterium]|nr:hypothetical protein [Anaerolineae bacterium]